MESVNPANGQVVARYPRHDGGEVARRLARAREAFPAWSDAGVEARGRLLLRVADLLDRRRDALAGRMVVEMGKPVVQAEAEVEKCAWVCRYYAEHAGRMLAPEAIASDGARSGVRYDPLGAVLAVMPWNFPLWQVFRCAAPTLAAGNVLLLKHASNVTGCALDIESVFEEAGAPEGVFQVLVIGASNVAGVIRDPVIRGVALTGSDGAGRDVAAAAGAALKRTVLELGGSDAFIVLADADPEAAAIEAARARCLNSGQSCIAAKRFIVEAPVADAFEAALARAMAGMAVGDPAERRTAVGPLARLDLRDDLHGQVVRSVEAGARVLTGGHPLPGAGAYYAPTVLADVVPGMAAFDEETFGPVAAVTRAANAADAIRLANASRFGLGASLWTRDAARGEALAARVDAGCVFVNGIVKSDPRLPFGGIKDSGWGRELGVFGIREFVNVKTVWVR